MEIPNKQVVALLDLMTFTLSELLKKCDIDGLKDISLTDFGIYRINLGNAIGQPVNCTDRTFYNYVRPKEDFKGKQYFLNYPAAYWLIKKKELTKAECQNFFASGNTKAELWQKYLDIKLDPKFQERKVTYEVSQYFSVPDLFTYRPSFGKIYRRTKHFADLQAIAENYSLAMVCGLEGTGKSFFVYDFQNFMIEQKIYSDVLWVNCSQGYKLDDLILQIQTVEHLGFGLNHAKMLNLVQYLEDTNRLLIFENFEESLVSSFSEVFKELAHRSAKMTFLLITSNNKQLHFIEDRQTIFIGSYSEIEVKELLHSNGIFLSAPLFAKLYEITDGLPFYVNELVTKAELNLVENSSDLDGIATFPRLTIWLEEVYNKLTAEEVEMLNLIVLYHENFNFGVITQIAKLLKIEHPRKTFDSLRNIWRIIVPDLGNFKVLSPLKINVMERIENRQAQKYYHAIATHLATTINVPLERNISAEHLPILAKSILNYQLAASTRFSNMYLQKYAGCFKKAGLYEQLSELLETEIINNKRINKWLPYHYAHCLFITGKAEKCFEVIIEIIPEILVWLVSSQNLKVREKEDVSYFLKVCLLYSEAISYTIGYSHAIEFLKSSVGALKPEELEWSLKSQVLSMLSWFYIQQGDYLKGTEYSVAILKDNDSQTQIGLGVANTRIGISFFAQENYEDAIVYLNQGVFFFKDCGELRGYSWASRYAILCNYKLVGELIGSAHILEVLSINQQLDLYDPIYLDWLCFFDGVVNSKEVSLILKSEIERITQIKNSLNVFVSRNEIEKNVQKIISEIKGVDRGGLSNVTIDKTFGHNAVPMNSILNHTYIDKLRADPRKYLEKLFADKGQKVFANFQYTKLLSELLKEDSHKATILDLYILPNLEYLKTKRDPRNSLQIHFARALQYAGQFDASLDLLSVIPERNQKFHYHNIKGNCFRKLGMFEESYKSYKNAIAKIGSEDEEGMVCNNIAKLIYDLNEESAFVEGIAFSRRAINARKFERSFTVHPKRILVLLSLQMEKIDNIAVKAEYLRIEIEYSRKDFVEIIKELRSIAKAHLILKAQGDNL